MLHAWIQACSTDERALMGGNKQSFNLEDCLLFTFSPLLFLESTSRGFNCRVLNVFVGTCDFGFVQDQRVP